MSDFLLLCVKFFCFLFVMIIVIWKIKVRYDKKNKIFVTETGEYVILILIINSPDIWAHIFNRRR
mgnify:CR=1 FL=1